LSESEKHSLGAQAKRASGKRTRKSTINESTKLE
jgi:hypothetical protein